MLPCSCFTLSDLVAGELFPERLQDKTASCQVPFLPVVAEPEQRHLLIGCEMCLYRNRCANYRFILPGSNLRRGYLWPSILYRSSRGMEWVAFVGYWHLAEVNL